MWNIGQCLFCSTHEKVARRFLYHFRFGFWFGTFRVTQVLFISKAYVYYVGGTTQKSAAVSSGVIIQKVSDGHNNGKWMFCVTFGLFQKIPTVTIIWRGHPFASEWHKERGSAEVGGSAGENTYGAPRPPAPAKRRDSPSERRLDDPRGQV